MLPELCHPSKQHKLRNPPHPLCSRKQLTAKNHLPHMIRFTMPFCLSVIKPGTAPSNFYSLLREILVSHILVKIFFFPFALRALTYPQAEPAFSSWKIGRPQGKTSHHGTFFIPFPQIQFFRALFTPL